MNTINHTKHRMLGLSMVIIMSLSCIGLTACQESGNVAPISSAAIEDSSESKNEVDIVRESVVEKFGNERDVLGTGRFIEDAHSEYPDDITISCIYYYNSSLTCHEYYNIFSESMKDSYLQQAKEFASKIPADYDGEFSDEMQEFANSLLGDERSKIIEDTASADEKYSSLTSEEKREIKRFIQDRYEHYDSINGGKIGDKYSNTIMEEAMVEFGLGRYHIEQIWGDYTIRTEEPQKPAASPKLEVQEYEATLEYGSGEVLITIDEDAMDDCMTALNKKDEAWLLDLEQSGKIAFTPKGTKCNVLKRKLTRCQVKILDGPYSGNIVWVVVESVHNK